MDKPYQHKVNDQRMHNMFVPAWLDELPVDVYAWRIYGRLVRRSGDKRHSWESVAKMAEGTLMSERRARQALNTLEQYSLIRREYRNQQTTIYHLVQPDSGLQQVQPYRHDVPPYRQDVPPLPAPDAAEGNTREVNTNEGNTKEKKKPSFSKTQAQELIDIFNEHRGNMPAVRAISDFRFQRLAGLVKKHGWDDARAMLEAATKDRAKDGWYGENNHGLDELLKQGRVVQYSERWEANKPTAPRHDTNLEYRATMEYYRRAREGHQVTYEQIVMELEDA
jgi:hypothetical protein